MKQCYLLIALCSILPSSMAGAASFVAQDIGYPVAQFEPVDVDRDGVWELAIRTDMPSSQFGIYSIKDSAWLDGPWTLPDEVEYWGVNDYDNDGRLEYAYLARHSIFIYDPADQRSDSLWTLEHTQAVRVEFWGEDSGGRDLVAVTYAHHYHEDRRCDNQSYYDCTGPRDEYTWTTILFNLLTGHQVSHFASGSQPSVLVYGYELPTSTHRLLLREWYDFDLSSHVGYNFYRVELKLVDELWRAVENAYVWNIQELSGPRDELFNSDFAFAYGGTLDEPFFAYDCISYYGMDIPSSVSVHRSAGYSLVWRSARVDAASNDDIEAFDLYQSGTPVWIFVRSNEPGWIIREITSSDVVEYLPDMPNVDLQVGALRSSGVPDLFYVSDGSVFVWSISIDTVFISDTTTVADTTVGSTWFTTTDSTTRFDSVIVADTSVLGDSVLIQTETTIVTETTVILDSTFITILYAITNMTIIRGPSLHSDTSVSVDTVVTRDTVVVADLYPKADTVITVDTLAVEDNSGTLPRTFALNAYPNPFNSAITLTWNSLAQGPSELEFVNITGQTVRTIPLGEGVYETQWDARDDRGNSVPSGVYFARFTSQNTTATVKIVLLK